MKRLKLIMVALIISAGTFAQTGIGTTTPEASAQLDVSSTTKGFLAPRMTAAQRTSISSPATGLMVYQTDAPAGYYYNNGTPVSPSWIQLGSASGATQWITTGNDIYYTTGNVGIGTTTPDASVDFDILGSRFRLKAPNSESSYLVVDNTDANQLSTIALQTQGGVGLAYLGLAGSGFSAFGGNNSLNIWNQASNGPTSFGTNDGSSTSERMRISATGNVGIGTTSPSYKLDVNGAINGTSILVNGVPVASSTNTYWNTAGSGKIYYNGGYVGIGTTSPAYELHVNENIGTRILNLGFGDSYARITTDDDSKPLEFQISGVTKMIINKTGNIGIGTSTPVGLLDLYDNSSNELQLHLGQYGTGQVTLRLHRDGGTATDWYQYIPVGSSDLRFHNGGQDRVTFTSTGNVGIGTTSPGVPLDVNGSAGINTYGVYFNSGGANFNSTTATFGVTIRASNDIMAGGSIVSTSDKRVKENITELHNSLELIGRLRPVSYNKIDKVKYGNRLNYGFIAQEVEEVIPNAVNTGKGEVPVLKPFEKVEFEDGVTYTILVKNGDDIKEQKYTTSDARPEGEIIVKSKTVNDFKSLSYDMIFTVAVDAIQEQQQEIERLKTALSQKDQDFAQLKAEVESLKRMIITGNNQLTKNQ